MAADPANKFCAIRGVPARVLAQRYRRIAETVCAEALFCSSNDQKTCRVRAALS
jgi:hypothetical protein